VKIEGNEPSLHRPTPAGLPGWGPLGLGLLPRALNDRDLYGREVVEFIDETVDLAVERGAWSQYQER
jgi:hypothetical protein